VDSIQLGNIQEVFKSGKASFNFKLVAYLVEMLFSPLANSITLSVGMPLINRNELGAEAKPHHRYLYLSHRHLLLSGIENSKIKSKKSKLRNPVVIVSVELGLPDKYV
jgi:hypothetical protein